MAEESDSGAVEGRSSQEMSSLGDNGLVFWLESLSSKRNRGMVETRHHHMCRSVL